MSRSKRATIDALIAEATVDCYNDSECVTGFYTMLENKLMVPFHTEVLGVDVAVTGVVLGEDDQVTAVCTRGRAKQRIPILDLPLPTPPPEGAECIDAYRYWLRGA
ncbi:calcium-binding protein [Actinokineospora auranticolor]|uniref:Calcium binding protein n=1 Tax=Actinokineospora auranticolor TaxID=155976 RepID=A0A2S6GF60_9PSEU|nr:calcium-binding protein [Actinokineospora auranticolor]PPK63801.1 calcium binding protein [Actinokineospora auranticolor]